MQPAWIFYTLWLQVLLFKEAETGPGVGGVGVFFLPAQLSGRPSLSGTSSISAFLSRIILLSALQKPGKEAPAISLSLINEHLAPKPPTVLVGSHLEGSQRGIKMSRLNLVFVWVRESERVEKGKVHLQVVGESQHAECPSCMLACKQAFLHHRFQRESYHPPLFHFNVRVCVCDGSVCSSECIL